jgi:uncharacterized protein (TIGR02246 family)
MKRTAIFLTFLFCLPYAAAAQALPDKPKQCDSPEIRKAMLQVIDDFKNGYNNGDPDKVAALYAEDATYLTQHFVSGIVHGRPAIRAYVKNGTDAKYKIDSIDLLTSGCTEDFAYGITRYASTNGTQKAVGVNLVLLRKTDGKWRIVAHESAVPDPANAIHELKIQP